jgi:polyribonucleotide nucleotidyltransferase
MDFKVAGSREGITALQMDIKVSGLSRAILEQALEQARRGRLQLLDVMDRAIAEPRAEISQYAPRIFQIKIDIDQIRNVIGPGGKTIRSIVDSTGAKINVEDDGTVQIATSDLRPQSGRSRSSGAHAPTEDRRGVRRHSQRTEPTALSSRFCPTRTAGPHLGDLARANPRHPRFLTEAIRCASGSSTSTPTTDQAVAAGDPRGQARARGEGSRSGRQRRA